MVVLGENIIDKQQIARAPGENLAADFEVDINRQTELDVSLAQFPFVAGRIESILDKIDLGESFGSYKIGMDEEVLHYITSANIACGWHAGDPLIMDKTVKMAIQCGVSVGAHP